MKRFLTWTATASLLTWTACAGFYGIKNTEYQTKAAIQKTAAKFKIPPGESFLLDTSYLSLVQNIDSTKKERIKNLSQPLQLIYYDRNGQPVSYHLNCYAGGFPNLKWERDGKFDVFPPQTRAPEQNPLSFSEQLQFIQTFDDKKIDPEIYSHSDYNVIVYWSVFMGRQSKRLIKLVQQNRELAKGKTVHYFFVNNDALFVADN